MKLSVIIVNYNVKFFLEQCINSVKNAINGNAVEIIVVDNHSTDGSVEMLQEKFTDIKTIYNEKNVGFSVANNQAIKQARGEYILLLNPDTVVEENTFTKVLSFMDSHPDAGGLGVKMIDGKGNFLPESKRGLPTPKSAFYKVFGLSRLFPNSETFNAYHLGYLDENQTNEVDILSGAFMLLRKSVLDNIGLLDETFFMYGEDIDLSYRITQSGFKNYYFPETKIIHYKGESTKKGSLNYVRTFYKAMKLFNQKHFSGSHAKSFSLLINLAIYLRAFLSLFARIIKTIYLPLIDAIILYIGMYFLTEYWEVRVKALNYPPLFMNVIVPMYVLTWIGGSYLYGAYDKPIKLSAIVRGVFSGSIVILIIYSLLPETLRFSRALILIGSFWAAIAMMGWRWLLSLFQIQAFELVKNQGKRIAIISESEEAQRIVSLLNMTGTPYNLIGLIDPNLTNKINSNDNNIYPHIIGTLDELKDIIKVYDINEVIFAWKNLSAEKIMKQMQILTNPNIEFKIAPPESAYIIGSNSIHNSGDLYFVDVGILNSPANKRKKRIFDIICSLLLLILSPIILLKVNRAGKFLTNTFEVLFGKKSWVSIVKSGTIDENTGRIKSGVLQPFDGIINGTLNPNTHSRINMLYARNYRIQNDTEIVWRNLKTLDK